MIQSVFRKGLARAAAQTCHAHCTPGQRCLCGQVTGNSFLHRCEDPAGRLSIIRKLLRFPASLPGKLAVPQTLMLTNPGQNSPASYHLVTDDEAGRFPLFKSRYDASHMQYPCGSLHLLKRCDWDHAYDIVLKRQQNLGPLAPALHPACNTDLLKNATTLHCEHMRPVICI